MYFLFSQKNLQTIIYMKDKARVFINTAIVFTSTIVENLIFFVINVIIARYLSIEHFGEYTTALGYATFFSAFCNIGINQTLIRAINLYPEREKENFSSAFIIRCVLSVVIYAALALSLYFTNYSRELVLLTLVMGVFRVGNEFLSSFYSSFDANEKFFLSSVFKIAFSFFFLILTIGVVIFHGGLFDFAYIRLWLVTGFLIVLLVTSRKLITLDVSLSHLYDFFKESIPFGIYTILGNIYQRTNIIILSLIHGSIYSGIFSNGFLFFTTLYFIPNNLTRVLLPFLYKNSDDSLKFQFAFDIYTKFLAMISFYFMMGAILYGKEVIYLIFGSKYHDSIIVLQIVALGIPFVFTITPTLITSLDRQPVLTRIYSYGFIINLLANFILIYFYKSEGAAAAAVITYGFIFIASHYYLIANKFISSYGIVKIFMWQIVIFVLCYILKNFIFSDLQWIVSLAVISMIFVLLNVVFVLNKNDARIVMEIFNIKKFPVKVYRK